MAGKRSSRNVADHKQEILDFKRFIWNRLPLRKYLCGHARVFDIVAVVIQEWPVEAVDDSKSGDTLEVQALAETSKSCKRHLALAYGQAEYDAWAEPLKYLIWQTIWLVLRWYRADKKHSALLCRWRSKWRHGKG